MNYTLETQKGLHTIREKVNISSLLPMLKSICYTLIICASMLKCSVPKNVIVSAEEHLSYLSQSEFGKAYNELANPRKYSLDQYVAFHDRIGLPGSSNLRNLKVESKDYELQSIEMGDEEYVVHYTVLVTYIFYSEVFYKNFRLRKVEDQWKIDEDLDKYKKVDSLMRIITQARNRDSLFKADNTIAEVLMIDPFHLKAKQQKERVTEDIAEFNKGREMIDSYMDSILFEYDKSDFYDYDREGRQEVIKLSLLNKGKKTICDLVLFFEFYDSEGNLLHSLVRPLIESSTTPKNYEYVFIDPDEKQAYQFAYTWFDTENAWLGKMDSSKTNVAIHHMDFR